MKQKVHIVAGSNTWVTKHINENIDSEYFEISPIGHNVTFKNYLEELKSIPSEDIIVILNEISIEKDNPLENEGIELIKRLRIKSLKLNPIVLLTINSITKILQRHPEHYIVFATSNEIMELPLNEESFLRPNFNPIKDSESLMNNYTPFIQADFKTIDIGHSLANEYGLYLMQKASEQALNIKFNAEDKVPENFLFDKAEFLYDYSLSKEGVSKLKKVYHHKTKIELAEKHVDGILERRARRIIYIDDQGGDKKKPGWFNWLQKLFNIDDDYFKGILPSSKNKVFDLDGTFVKVKDAFNENLKPDLIYLDLRLLGDDEKSTPLKEVSGAKLLKAIKEWDASIPVIIVSATDRLKSLAILQRFPYSADDFWGKPRIEKGDLDLNDSLKTLCEKTKKCIRKNNKSIDKAIANSKYQLNQLKANEDFLTSYNTKVLDGFDYIFFDTNFFSETNTEKLNKNHKLFHIVLEYYNKYNSGQSIIINDVWKELFLNTIKNSNSYNLKAASNYSLKKLIEYVKLDSLCFNQELISLENHCKNLNVEPDLIEVNDKEHYRVILKQSIDKHYVFSRKEANDKLSEIEKHLKKRDEEGKPIKTLLHADDTFRLMIKKLVKDNYKILFVAEDYNCRREIILELHTLSETYKDYSFERGIRSGFNEVKNLEKQIICTLFHYDNLAKKLNIQ